MASVAMVAFASADAAWAQTKSFDVPAQPAATGVAAFARQADVQLLISAADAQGRRTNDVRGAFSVTEALRLLLSGTGLTAQPTGSQTWTLVRASAPGAQLVNAAYVQSDAPISSTSKPTEVEEVVVTGSQIAGAKITGALPVAILDQDKILATGAVSADELFRAMPEAGDISFTPQFGGAGSQNLARGDVSTVSLRGLPQGNTLLLINGRRTVVHPTSQTDLSTPVFGYNVNTVPVPGLARVEVLKDGASAIYGSDAVAGVVNNILRRDVTGLEMGIQYGYAPGADLKEWTGDISFGTNFAGDRGNLSVFLSGATRTAVNADAQSFTRTGDFRPLVAGTAWASTAAFDIRSNATAWGSFSVLGGPGTITSNGVSVTDASGAFLVQPPAFAGCLQTGGPVCLGPGAITSPQFSQLRLDSPMSFKDLTILPSVDRINAFAYLNFDLTENVTAFSELGYYAASTHSRITPPAPLSSAPMTIAANAFWNPFGPISSPNRLPGLNTPAAGLPIRMTTYALIDTGPRKVDVDNDQLRFLVGLRGRTSGWKWESAALYTEASVTDISDAVSNTLFQQALNRTDATAYNPFNGGNPTNLSIGDGTPNARSTLDTFLVKSKRKNTTTLALIDFNVSRPDLLTIWSGDVGVAAGVEYRRDTYEDDRDPRQDGAITYRDSVTGILYGSDLMLASPSPDVKGSREVASAFVEFALPIISPDWNIPLMRSVNLQFAGRFENYSDVGSVAKPKIAGSWDVFDGLRLRGSWSQGFKAPNLEVLNTAVLERSNSRRDFIQCEADLRAGRIANFAQCTRAYFVTGLVQGNRDLKPEESESYSYGLVFSPRFLPEELGEITFTVDKWNIQQEGIVGTLTEDVAINLDYLARLGGGSNPLVTRAAPTAQQVSNFAGTGLTPVGDVTSVDSRFQNLLPLEVGGIDYTATYRKAFSGGVLSVTANASNLRKYFQAPSDDQQRLVEAKAAGVINSGVPVANALDLVAKDGRPEWKYSISATLDRGNWAFGWFTQYTGETYQPSVLSAQGAPFRVDNHYVSNVYLQYRFPGAGLEANTTVRLGVRNVFDKDPPFSAPPFVSPGAFVGSLYNPVPRYWSVHISKGF
ncbi:MAG: TonB-dependent receptor [Phenylobacterium sp.]|uniref:TonB-dependent receptor n=1 Tax=Phenylobacterium sp. TaxID=1871053 RepID=UPI00271C3E69|nr:TonB-dependent receptor [Phenylobacterium sp.]MDO8910239.1 TonB-dependent receptor [Phenylobacterium sp.]MDP3102769.1 TonB-dependent receptor [Phenylobacterium sp.]